MVRVHGNSAWEFSQVDEGGWTSQKCPGGITEVLLRRGMLLGMAAGRGQAHGKKYFQNGVMWPV